VGRDLRARVVLAFRRQGLTLPAAPDDGADQDGRHASGDTRVLREGRR
jgi:hypothetical protein